MKIDSNCDLDLKNYKLSKLHSNLNYWNFGIICGTDNTFQFSIFSGETFEIINNYNNIIIQLHGEENKNPNLVFYPSMDYGIYFQQKNDIKFLYLEKTFCENITLINIPITFCEKFLCLLLSCCFLTNLLSTFSLAFSL